MGLFTDRAIKQAKKRIAGIPDPVLDKVCTDLKDTVNCEAAFVSFVTSDRSYVVGSRGIAEEYLSGEGVALNVSFCAHLVQAQADGLMVIPNTRESEFLRYCPTTSVYGSWVGAPIHFKGRLIGAIGAVDKDPRNWTPREIAAVRDAIGEVESRLRSN